jgi:hypothetical protein
MQNAGHIGKETDTKQMTNNKVPKQELLFPALRIAAGRYGQV